MKMGGQPRRSPPTNFSSNPLLRNCLRGGGRRGRRGSSRVGRSSGRIAGGSGSRIASRSSGRVAGSRSGCRIAGGRNGGGRRSGRNRGRGFAAAEGRESEGGNSRQSEQLLHGLISSKCKPDNKIRPTGRSSRVADVKRYDPSSLIDIPAGRKFLGQVVELLGQASPFENLTSGNCRRRKNERIPAYGS